MIGFQEPVQNQAVLIGVLLQGIEHLPLG